MLRKLHILVCGVVLTTACENNHTDQFDTDHVIFEEKATEAGLAFTHVTGASDNLLLPEIVGAGAGLFDYDNDGDLDIYLLQGGPKVTISVSRLTNRLFQNQLIETGAMRFIDVTESTGLGHGGYAMGVATGDYDNDGNVDLYITNFGANVLMRNNGDGTFTDVTTATNTNDPRWSSSASFLDYDRDGFLDLFVTNYVADSVVKNRPCENTSGQRDYCSPTVFQSTGDRLFRNTGKGDFIDVTNDVGIGHAKGPGLGVVGADFNGNGWPDIFVANDQSANFLWRNSGKGRFEEVGLVSGSGFNKHGMAEASMGVSAGDFDNDGDEDLFMTHLGTQTNTLYVNDGHGYFTDTTDRAGLGPASLMFTGFGSKWFDYDNDSRLDLFVANGSVIMDTQLKDATFPYQQRNQLFHNEGKGQFTEVSGHPNGPLGTQYISRGAAFGDIDNDGDVDIVAANNSGPAQLMLNANKNSKAWLMVKLIGTRSNRDGIGARLELRRPGKATLWRRCNTDGSFLSANDSRVHFGLDNYDGAVSIVVHWPSGTSELWPNLQSGQLLELTEGTGETFMGSDS